MERNLYQAFLRLHAKLPFGVHTIILIVSSALTKEGIKELGLARR